MTKATRYTHPMLRGFVFVRRPVSDLPDEGTVGFVDDGHASGWHCQQVVAIFRSGAWTGEKGRPLPFTPTFWTTIEKITNEV